MLNSLRYDFRLIRNDPMLILSSFVPFIVWALMQFGFPLLRTFVLDTWSYDIHYWFPHASYFFLILIPMMVGMVYGFILLDERDEGILSAVAVTPLGKAGYLRNRLGIPILISFLAQLIYLLILDPVNETGTLRLIIISALVSSQALIMLLFLGAFAKNKIMGLAISKGFGILLMGPLLDYVLPGRLSWIGAYSPMFWTGRALLAGTARECLIYFIPALAFHLMLILILYRIFLKRPY